MIARDHLIDVVFVIVPHSLLLDIAGPAEAFRLANQHRARSGLPPRFRLRYAGPTEMQATSVGLSTEGRATDPDAPTWRLITVSVSSQARKKGSHADECTDGKPTRSGVSGNVTARNPRPAFA